ncbi:MAG: DUF4124 domain-containing protein [bacterium]|nr:DUF4124 domain-containing protein [bacterium]
MTQNTRVRSLFCALFSVLLISAAASSAGADEFYRWVDDKGQKHFADSVYGVPEKYRDQIDDLRDSFDQGADLSVIDGLDERYAPKTPEGQAESTPTKAQFDPEKFMGPDGPDFDAIMDAMGPLSVAAMAGIAGALLLFVIVGLVIAAFFLKIACQMVGVEEAPSMPKAMGVTLLQGLLSGLAQMTLQVALVPDPQSISASGALGLLSLNAGVGFALNIAVLRGMVTDSLGKAIGVQITIVMIGFALGLAIGILALAASCAGA